MRWQWRFAVMLLGALLVAGAVWTWLPPNDATPTAVFAAEPPDISMPGPMPA